MKRLAIVLFLIGAATGHAQVVATDARNIVVAHDGRIELFDSGLNRVWTTDGVDHPSKVVIGNSRVAVIDSFANRMRIVDIATGRPERLMPTGETPIDAVFIGGQIFVLDRDSARVERLGGAAVSVAPDPAFIRAANDRLFVYSRLDGVMQEIAPATMRVTRTLVLAPFASDFETDGRTGYLVFPQDARLRTFSLATMKRTGDIGAGVVPVDLTVTSRANALSASRLALADPSAKRVWVVEGAESITGAVTRGFLRGLLGFGLFKPASSNFPTGVDRVAVRGSITVAYDSTTGTLYRVAGSRSVVLAHDVGPAAFAIADGSVAVWQNGSLRLIR
ncbi:MAG: hypothetical protein NVSMB68_12330 [Thermoanaerobaculia bacterium]